MIILPDRAYFRARKITRDREHSIMVKGSVHQDEIAILNVYASNNRAANYIKQKVIGLKGETENPQL